MAHPAYYNKAGIRVPSVTTIIGGNLGWSKDMLMGWAYRQGKEGKEFRETTAMAASAGTLAHSMFEHDILGQEYVIPEGTPEEIITLANTSFSGYKRWRKGSTLILTRTELSLVSEKYQYGGTIDVIGHYPEEEGTHEVVDWKTANGTYADHVIQVTAYAHLYQEVTGIPVTGVHICRVPRDNAGWHHHSWSLEDLEPAWNAFTHLRALHYYKRTIERMV